MQKYEGTEPLVESKLLEQLALLDNNMDTVKFNNIDCIS